MSLFRTLKMLHVRFPHFLLSALPLFFYPDTTGPLLSY